MRRQKRLKNLLLGTVMHKLASSLLLFFISIVLTACGSTSPKPVASRFHGNLAGYYEGIIQCGKKTPEQGLEILAEITGNGAQNVMRLIPKDNIGFELPTRYNFVFHSFESDDFVYFEHRTGAKKRSFEDRVIVGELTNDHQNLNGSVYYGNINRNLQPSGTFRQNNELYACGVIQLRKIGKVAFDSKLKVSKKTQLKGLLD